MQLYEKFLRPALKPYVTLIDVAANDAINTVQGAATKLTGEATAAVVTLASPVPHNRTLIKSHFRVVIAGQGDRQDRLK